MQKAEANSSTPRTRKAPLKTSSGIASILLMVLGSALTAVCFNTILRPNQIVPGGVVGLSLVLQHAFGFEPAFSQWTVNICLVGGFGWLLGRGFILRSAVGSLLLPLFVFLTRAWAPLTANPILAALVGGAGVGAGVGLLFRAGGSIGGYTALAMVAHKRLGLSLDHAFLFLDGCTLLAASRVFPSEKVLASLLCCFVVGRAVRAVVSGFNGSKVATIVSAQAPVIRDAVLQDIPLGVTVLESRGGYTGKAQEVLMIVLNQGELIQLKSLVRRLDPQAFMILHDATEVLGHGWTPHA